MKTYNARKRRRVPEDSQPYVLRADPTVSRLGPQDQNLSMQDIDDPYSFEVEDSNSKPQLSPQFLAGLAAGSFPKERSPHLHSSVAEHNQRPSISPKPWARAEAEPLSHEQERPHVSLPPRPPSSQQPPSGSLVKGEKTRCSTFGLSSECCPPDGPELCPPLRDNIALVKESPPQVVGKDRDSICREAGDAAVVPCTSVTAPKRQSREPLLTRTRTSQSAPADLGSTALAGSAETGGTRDPGAFSDGETDTVDSTSMPPPPARPTRFSASSIPSAQPKCSGKAAAPAPFPGGCHPAVPPVASGCPAAPSKYSGFAGKHTAAAGLQGPPQRSTHLERPSAPSKGSFKAPCFPSRLPGPKGDLRKAVLLKNGIAECPAKGPTVTEAQESGEQWQVLDNVTYALDGLKSSRATTQRESAATLAEICASRRSRVSIRAEGLFEDIMRAGAAAHPAEDPVTALAFGVLLLGFSQDAASHSLLASSSAAAVLREVLQAPEINDEDARGDAAVAKLQKLLGGALGKGLPRTQTLSPSSIALLALIWATDPQQSSTGMELLKEALREEGVLEQLASLAALKGDRLPSLDAEPDSSLDQGSQASEAERAAWWLKSALLALENASFACPANEGHLAGLSLPPHQDVADQDAPRSLPACLLQQALFLGKERESIDRATRRSCLHAGLSVLMNLTHAQEKGCTAFLASGGLSSLPWLLESCLPPVSDTAADRDAVLENMDILSVGLGVLINVAENGGSSRAHLPGPSSPPLRQDITCEDGDSGKSKLLPLLCRLIRAGGGGEEPPSPLKRRSSFGGVEVTEAALRRGEEEGNAAIVEVYASLLLAFLLEGDPAACEEAAAMLPGGSLQGVVGAVERCLSFYLDTGAITARTEAGLRRLLASLKSNDLP
eukprot:jgi/Botrbrau1/2072/Bobra.0047s0035.1